jgi:hypothetical protein
LIQIHQTVPRQVIQAIWRLLNPRNSRWPGVGTNVHPKREITNLTALGIGREVAHAPAANCRQTEQSEDCPKDHKRSESIKHQRGNEGDERSSTTRRPVALLIHLVLRPYPAVWMLKVTFIVAGCASQA